MISIKMVQKYCCEDISQIENYDEAIKDETTIWDCHHRNETDLNMKACQLIKAGLYYNRPANELIFLTPSKHWSIHMSGKRNPNYGKPMSIEKRAKISKNNGCHRQEVRDKISNTMKKHGCGLNNKNAVGGKGHTGLKWITDDINERAIPIGTELPSGWRFGRKRNKNK